jgi:hypothetical protein
MSHVRMEFPKLRLATQLQEAGGITVAEAVEAAAENLEILRPQVLNTLQATANDLQDAMRQLPREFAAEPMHALYAIASRAVGMGGLCGSPGADVVLHSLCGLLDRLSTAGRGDLPAIAVHVQTLQLLAFNIGGANDEQMTAKVLSGLKKVSDRYPEEAPPQAAVG